MPPIGPSRQRLTWSLTVDRQDEAAAVVLKVAGRLGTGTAPALAQALDQAVAVGTAQVVLDLGGVDYVSSAGLKVIENAATGLRARGTELVLRGLQEPVRVSFEVSGADARLDMNRMPAFC